jgi:hypothetical protein
MVYSGSIHFFGEYRPAYFEADTILKLQSKMLEAIKSARDAQWFEERIRECTANIYRRGYAASAIEHGPRGVDISTRPHDPWLDSTFASFPAYPGLDYSAAINVA